MAGVSYGGEASRPLHEDGAGESLARPSHEEDSMTRRTSSNPFMRTQAANLKRLPHEVGAERWNGPEGARELLNNSIKLDKFTGFFDKFLKIIARKKPCKMLKNNDFNVNMRAGRSNKGPDFFSRSAFARTFDELSAVRRISRYFPANPHPPPTSAHASRMRCLTNHAVFWVTSRCLASWTLEMPLREALIR